MKIKINFAYCSDKTALEFEAGTIREAVELAVRNGISLRGADLTNADLYGAHLDGADLSGARLFGANLCYARLSGANLRDAIFCNASLQYAYLGGADLTNADLYVANLHCANLRCVDLTNADLYGANLSSANLYGAKHDNKELWKTRPVLQLGCYGPAGQSTLVMFYEDKSEPKVCSGFFRGTFEDFETTIREVHTGTFHKYEYMAMIDHIWAIRNYQLRGAGKNEK